MDERPGEGLEPPDPSGGAGEDDAADAPEEELTPEAKALAEEAAEIRRMVEEGAGSPEAIRALAARLREHRAREEELWRTAVKPSLVKEGKGRLRGHSKPTPEVPRTPPEVKQAQSVWLGGGLLALVLIVVVAANTSVWVLVLPVLALLAWAWHQGRDSTSGQ
ncbi:MAG: hypothetical protein ACRDZU_10265 [Acidimicrobiales bacterium]